MRVVFHNPHVNIWFKTPLYFYLTKRKSYDKYEYMLDYCLNNNVEFAFICDGLDFSFGRSFLRGTFFAKIELMLWCFINKINPFKVKIYTDFGKLTKNDMLFSFLYGNFAPYQGTQLNPDKITKLISYFANCKAFKVLHVTHYMFNVDVGAHNAMLANIDLLVAENNLSANSSYFQEYYKWYKKDVYNLAFVAQKRFKKIDDFNTRTNKAVATGTLMFKLTEKNFIEHFPAGDLHPMRRAIYENREVITDYVDSFIHEMEDVKAIAKSSENIFKKIYNFYYVNFKAKQKKYFSFNIVTLYNSYKMFIVPEEVVALPGIGFIEGMSCGTVYVGKDDPMYTDIGMVDGVNYIAYDGTLKNLLQKLEYYTNNADLLAEIAENSMAFVNNRIQPDVVCKSFFESVNKLMLQKDKNLAL